MDEPQELRGMVLPRMDKNTDVSSDSSQQSSNEYLTADELGVDTVALKDDRGEPSTPTKSRKSLRVLGIMDAIRSGLSSPFSRTRSPKKVAKVEPPDPNEKDENEGITGDCAAVQSFSAQFQPNNAANAPDHIYDHRSKDAADVGGDILKYRHSLTKYEKDQTRPVFGFDTRSFGARSSSDHAIASKYWRQNLRSRRKRVAGSIRPCESDSSEALAEDAYGARIADEALMRKASSVLVNDAMRKAISYLTVQNMLLENSLDYADLQKGDVRYSKDFVFWEIEDDSTPSLDVEEGRKPKYVSTPYPKKRPKQERGESVNNDSYIAEKPKFHKIIDDSEKTSSYQSKFIDTQDEAPPVPVVRYLSEEYDDSRATSAQPDDDLKEAFSDPTVERSCEDDATESTEVWEYEDTSSPTRPDDGYLQTTDDYVHQEDIAVEHSDDVKPDPSLQTKISGQSENECEVLSMPIDDRGSNFEEVTTHSSCDSEYIDDAYDEVRSFQSTSVRKYIEDICAEIREGHWLVDAGSMNMGDISEPKQETDSSVDVSPICEEAQNNESDYDKMTSIVAEAFDDLEYVTGVDDSCDEATEQTPPGDVSDELLQRSEKPQDILQNGFEDASTETDDVLTIEGEDLMSCEDHFPSAQPSDVFEDASPVPIKPSNDDFEEAVPDVRKESPDIVTTPKDLRSVDKSVEDIFLSPGLHDDKPCIPTVVVPAQVDNIDERDDAFTDALDDDENKDDDPLSAITDVTPMDYSVFLPDNVDDTRVECDNKEALTEILRTTVAEAKEKTEALPSTATEIATYRVTESYTTYGLSDAAERIVKNSIQDAKDVLFKPEPEHVEEPSRQPQCWEDLLIDDDAMSLSDFDVSEIVLMRDELAGLREDLREDFDAAAKDLKDTGGSEERTRVSPRGPVVDRSVEQPIIEQPHGDDDKGHLETCLDEVRNINEFVEHQIEDISRTSSDVLLRNKISFWEDLCRRGPIVSERADRVISCGFCKDNHSIRSSSPVPCNLRDQAYEISEYESDIDEEEPSPELHEDLRDDSIGKTATVISYDLESGKAQGESDDGTLEATPRVKTRISIWEKLPLRRGQNSGKASVNLNTSTREKVAFFEQMSTPQSGFHKRSSSPLSFKKDDWLRRLRKRNDLSGTSNVTDISPLVRQPNVTYDSGVWTNQAFFQSPSLEISSAEKPVGEEEEKTQEIGIDKQVVDSERIERREVSDYRDISECRVDRLDQTDYTGQERMDESKMSIEFGTIEDRNALFEETAEDREYTVGDESEFQYDSTEELDDHIEAGPIGDGHEFFLEVIGEKEPTVETTLKSSDADGIHEPALKVIGSEIELKPAPKDVISAIEEGAPLKRNKNKFLSIFRKKSKKQTSSGKTHKLTKEGKGPVDADKVEHQLDKQIKKKAKKSKSNDWGFIDIKPEVAELVWGKHDQGITDELNEKDPVGARQKQIIYSEKVAEEKDEGGVTQQDETESKSKNIILVRDNLCDEKTSLNKGSKYDVNRNNVDQFGDYDSDNDYDYETAVESLAIFEVQDNGVGQDLCKQGSKFTPDDANHEAYGSNEQALEVIGSKMKLHEADEAPTAEIPTKESDITLKKNKKKLTLFRKKSKKQIPTPVERTREDGKPVKGDTNGDLPDYVEHKIRKKSNKSPSKDWGFIDIKVEADNSKVKAPPAKKKWRMFHKT